MLKLTPQWSTLLAILLVSIAGLLFLMPWLQKDGRYRVAKIVRLTGLSEEDPATEKAIQDAKTFVEELVSNYLAVVTAQANPRFRNEFRLWKTTGLGTKMILSTFSECLLYIYPAARNELIVESIDLPIQFAFLNGLIDLDRPEAPTNTSRIRLLVAPDQAQREYKAYAASIISSGTGVRISGKGTFRFQNTIKMIVFQQNSIFGFYNGFVEVDNTDPGFVQAYGQPVSFRLRLLGPLLLTGERNFSWASQEASKLGKQLAEGDIQALITESEFFRLSLAHSVLKPQADAILKKTARSREDPSFEYPLWEFKRDVSDLRQQATKSGIESSYVEELLKVSSPKVDGTLFWYYPNLTAFTWQWMAANLFILLILVLLQAIKASDGPVWHLIRPILMSWLGEKLLFAAPVAINGFIFLHKPASLGLSYWIGPGILLVLCIGMSVVLSRDQ